MGAVPAWCVYIVCSGSRCSSCWGEKWVLKYTQLPTHPSSLTFVCSLPPRPHPVSFKKTATHNWRGDTASALPKMWGLLINSFATIWSAFLQAQSSKHRHLLWWTGASEEENLNVTSIADNWRSLAKETQAGFLQPASPNGSIFSHLPS